MKSYTKLSLVMGTLVLLPQCDFFKKEEAPAKKEAPAKAARTNAQKKTDSSEVLMSIGGEAVISKNSFEEYMNEFLEAQPQYKQVVEFMPDAKRNIFEGQVNEEIISKWAEDKGIETKSDYQKDLDKIIKYAKRSLNVKYFQDAHPVNVSPVEVRKYYDENKHSPQLMKSSGGVEAQAVMFDSKEKATAFFDKVKAAPAQFDSAAKEAGLTVKNLGMVGKQSWDVEGPLREKVLEIKSYPKVEMVTVSDKSFAVVKATGKKEAEHVPFEEVKSGIENFLKQQKMGEAIQKELEKLRGQYKIEINEDYFNRDKKAKEKEQQLAMEAMKKAAPKQEQAETAAPKKAAIAA